jgi:hypothetical protein
VLGEESGEIEEISCSGLSKLRKIEVTIYYTLVELL